MSFAVLGIALVWGVISGYLVIHTLDNVVGMCFCLHGLLMGRWKRLANKAATGVIKPRIILALLFRVTLYAILSGSLLQYGYNVTLKNMRFDYEGTVAIIYAVVAFAVALSRLPATRRRLTVIWRMSHEIGYAERRQRTSMLGR